MNGLAGGPLLVGGLPPAPLKFCPVTDRSLQKGMDLFEFRQFLHQNPSAENLAFVFPSEDDIAVTPEMLTAVSVIGMTSSSTDVFHEETFDFFQLFLHDLHNGHIGIYYVTALFSVCQQSAQNH